MTEATVAKLKSTLKQAGSGATSTRVAIFSTLQNGPITIGQMLLDVGKKADRATVYRTIDLFEKLGIVNRIWYGSEPLVELSEIFVQHHHHALCQNCGSAIDVYSGELESTLAALAKKYDFLALSHSVEISGYCQDCQK
jgi:Fur family transcriptional regulator, ferric uptake regulator